MKNILKSTLSAVVVVAFLAACTSKTETTSSTQDSVKVDTTQVVVSVADSTAVVADSTATK